MPRMWDFWSFLGSAIVISLSGVMAPGAITAATIAAGARNRHAGSLIALGHGVVEFPLMVLIVLGASHFLQGRGAQIGIGLVGGAVLVFTAIMTLLGLRGGSEPAPHTQRWGPLVTGIVLSAANPYFLVWWATVGLALTTRAMGLGVWAFAIFAVVHWALDLIWLEALSMGSSHGARLLGPRAQKAVLVLCSAAMLFFAATFIRDGVVRLCG
ncbi:MAG: LysE family translocator [Planctomycetaceae bacterium]|nr:LysE family translocator [Planctomycetaceae bacterium]